MLANQNEYEPRRAWVIAIMLACMMTVNFLDKVVLGMVAVPLMRDLSVTPTEFGLIGGSLNWLFAIFAIVGGLASERFKTRHLIMIMALAWSVLQLPMMVASSALTVLILRVLLGASEGPASPLSLHALSKWFPNEKRGLPSAVLYQGSALGLLLAGILIPAITLKWGWRSNFLVLAVVGLVWCVLWQFIGGEGTLRQSKDKGCGRRLPYRVLLADKTILGVFCAHFAAYWMLAVTLTWLPHYLQAGLGFPAARSGHLFSLIVAGATLIAFALAWLSQKLLLSGVPSRKSRGVFIAISLIVAGLFRASVALPLTPIEKILLLMIGNGMGQVMFSVGATMIGEVTPDSQRGTILALSNAIGSVSGLIAPVITGMMIEHAAGFAANGFEASCVLTAAVLVLAGLVCIRWLNPAASQWTKHKTPLAGTAES
ncbi:MFS transporter [Paraburkholderia acidisoli]|uniref:MFS transporter n=1 Tax=Paraburkholderia acidisoli TaxID=2571748 RepID=A0A7Z2JJR7_9BURK|nr:MFS transporter [Paraburkholderia acidisoli]QGZ65574.1 MFS transporter [Paraburkholderia acidisoli]